MRVTSPGQIGLKCLSWRVARRTPMPLLALLFMAHPACTNGAVGSSGPGSAAAAGTAGDNDAGNAGASTVTAGNASLGMSSASSSSTGGSAGASSAAPSGSSGSSGSGTSGSTSSQSSNGSSSSGGGAGNDSGAVVSNPVNQVDGGAFPTCAGSTYKLCEDFETGAVGGYPTGWTEFQGYGAVGPTDVALASNEFHSGKQSLESDSMDKGQARAQKAIASIGTAAYNHWGRIFYKVQSPSPKPNTYLHVTFVSLNGSGGEDRIVDTVEMTNTNEHQWLFNVPSDSCCTSSAYSWTYDAAWHCAEWYVDVTTQAYRFFTDSVEVPALAFGPGPDGGAGNKANGNTGMSDYTAVIVGATFYQGTGAIASPFVIWFDDLAIDDAANGQIGCTGIR